MSKLKQPKKRAAGVLLPVFSLPSPYGIGSLGKAAKDWILFLEKAGQKYWQTLPLGPTIYGDSPYQSPSAFAGNPYYIDLDLMAGEGLLTRSELESASAYGAESKKVDYYRLFKTRKPLLLKAFKRFNSPDRLEEFHAKNAFWLDDYALYEAVKYEMGLKSWVEWDDDIRLREKEALEKYRKKLNGEIQYHIFVQYMFYKQWKDIKKFANSHGIKIIGDVPIYVALDSADVWAQSDLFLLDENKNPIEVAGCPPDAFSKTGQLWGNPLYDWEKMKKDGYKWQIQRLSASFDLYDTVRIDHFRGFESYYAIPAEDKTAENGEWRKGPGKDFISALHKAMPDAQIIAEDLGYLTPEVRELLEFSGYPGMKVLQFAFDSREESDYLPYNYNYNSVAFTGTHDNDTVLGWFKTARPDDIQLALDYLGLNDMHGGNFAFLRAALQSASYLAIAPIQDYLSLSSEGRINIPSTLGGNNWRWRLSKNDLSDSLADKMARMAWVSGRKRPIKKPKAKIVEKKIKKS